MPDSRTTADHGSRDADLPNRVWTVPNILSFLRLAGVPLFLWLLLGPEEDLLAFAVLVFAGLSDWLDGKLARWLNQSSRLGALLDPAADRLYILATLLAFLVRDFVPWWVVAVLVGREVVLGVAVLVLRRLGYGPFDVHYIGKAATFCLMYAFPLLLLTDGHYTGAVWFRPLAYAFTIWGGAMYVWAAVLYLIQLGGALRVGAPGRPARASGV
ncbi:cardiolipin synthase [Crossiella equi]|uniref:Cardiolipin synthase n=1 Tax=Crossiella equi TaxID=130796 RepID=A0ABS5A8U5_9PSEU|nr:CDP-alcohol phosphatidyltransferase family protein [Crossiella equi]MBP2472995.1 cardiolipin synthase [Crossiella equi]